MTLSSGARLGPHEIQSPLGKGGMGEVYRATDTRLQREVEDSRGVIYGAATMRCSSPNQGRTTARQGSFIGFRELISARGNALFQLFCPVHDQFERSRWRPVVAQRDERLAVARHIPAGIDEIRPLWNRQDAARRRVPVKSIGT